MKTRILLCAALLLGGADLRAQEPASADTLPACADGGISRMAITVPPGRTREEVIGALGGLLPEGTQVKILAPHERPHMVNTERFLSRWRMHMDRFLSAGLQVNGAESTLLEVNADGVVTEAHPSTGNREVDRGLRDLWRQARYEPVVVGGCRVPAWLHVGLDFESEYRSWERSVGTRIRS